MELGLVDYVTRGGMHLYNLWRSRSQITPPPTIFHITHWKAGSQWIHKILACCAQDRIVSPLDMELQFVEHPLLAGKVYPTVYVTKSQFDSVALPPQWRRFVVIRDLRDTLVSSYFSIMFSHAPTHSRITDWRSELRSRNLEQGLLFLVDKMMPLCADIQLSWWKAGEPLIRYEDLLARDEEILRQVLLEHCRLAVAPDTFRQIVRANRFQSLTSGRSPGQENVYAHERKGVAGDWRNNFGKQVTKAFKERYGDLLIATGYEKDLNW